MSTKSVCALWISVWIDLVRLVIGRFQPPCSFIRQLFMNLFKSLDAIGNEASMPTTYSVVPTNARS